MREEILKFLQENSEWKTGDFVNLLQKDRTTIYRNLKKLEQEGKILQVKKWLYRLKENFENYFNIPVWERNNKFYNPDLLRKYKPNETFFFSQKNLKKLEDSIKFFSIETDFYKTNKRFIEKLLIDLSFASSYLEGNTYSYLDTEILLKYNEINKKKTEEETRMILNHKKAIEYIIFYKKELKFNKNTFFEVHSLLGENLLPKNDLWIIRNKTVEIWWSSYLPLENKFRLNEEFEIFLQKLNQIKNPFEQSIFIMIFIPYFQLFLDINKRTSRIVGNLPLIKNNLPLLSMVQIEKKKYIMAILAIYELNNFELLEEILVESYLSNLEKYKKYF